MSLAELIAKLKTENCFVCKVPKTKGKGKKMEICIWTDCCLDDVTYNDAAIMSGRCPQCGHECDFGEGEEIPERD